MNTPWGMFAIVRILDTRRSYSQEEGILSIPAIVSHTTSFPLILITTLPLYPAALQFCLRHSRGGRPCAEHPLYSRPHRSYRLVAATLPVRQPPLILVRTQTIR